jgi:hypothetical protein
MHISLDHLSDSFIDHLCQLQAETPYVFDLQDVKRAGAQLQRLARGLAPHVEGGLVLTGEDVTRLAGRYMDHHQSPRTEPLVRAFGRDLLEHAPEVTPEGRQWLEQAMNRNASTVEQLQERRAQMGSPAFVGK